MGAVQIKWIEDQDALCLHCVFHNISDLKNTDEMNYLINSIPRHCHIPERKDVYEASFLSDDRPPWPAIHGASETLIQRCPGCCL